MQRLRTPARICAALAAILLTACSDGPTGPNPPAGSGSSFSLEVRYIGSPTATQRAAVDNAVTRWRAVIKSELENVPINVPAGRCFASQPALNETVDDLVLYVEFMTIDGVGKVLGQSGPCYIRTVGGLPIFGYMQLDVADAARVESQGLLKDLVLHEMGHVLGFGTLWEDATLLTGAGSANPTFTGSSATAAFRQLSSGAQAVPVENVGTSGTRDSHWRETIMGTELMTGFLNGSPNPLSSVTIASLQDLGYETNAASADAYTLNGNAAANARFEIHSGEEIVLPRYRVDRNGVVQQIVRF